ncbi:DnaJ sub C member 8 [Sporothrix curviconia]|uniref:DnaJ sub C member 8 n=1 Tax=Sporothrix curviconia TaxID=1260050 RepID=A0ABP0AX39_9PEZI
MADDDGRDAFDILESENKEAVKDEEIERILGAFRLDAYAVLGLQPGVPESDIKNTYRKKSLLIHPDKTRNPRAPDAFDRLKKAQTELMDEKHRERLDEAIADARMLLMRENKWTADSPELKTDDFKAKWADRTKYVLIDNEQRRQRQLKVQMQEEGREQRREEEEIEARKRKRQHAQDWEATRDQRIDSWRKFASKGKSGSSSGANGGPTASGGIKKKKKIKTLG